MELRPSGWSPSLFSPWKVSQIEKSQAAAKAKRDAERRQGEEALREQEEEESKARSGSGEAGSRHGRHAAIGSPEPPEPNGADKSWKPMRLQFPGNLVRWPQSLFQQNP